MKRKIIAWTAVLLIVAVVAACFLRPAPRDKEVYTISQPVKMELCGKDADRFEVYVVGFFAWNNDLIPDFKIAVRSLDGNYYSLGKSRWVEGWNTAWYSIVGHPYDEDAETCFGYVERLGENGWEKVTQIGDAATYMAMFTGRINNFICPKEERTPEEYVSYTNIPYRIPGHYRVTLFARDYIPPEDRYYENQGIDQYGSSGDELYEFQFEYEVPKRSEEPLEVMLLHLEIGGSDMTGATAAILNASLRANENIRYVQPDTMVFERRDPLTGRYTEVVSDSKYGAFWFQNTRTYINAERRLRESAESGSLNYDIEEMLTTIPMYNVCLFGWNTRDEYRLSVDFTEHEDGTGERYTLTLRLRFDE